MISHDFGFGIACYNEAQNIGRLLEHMRGRFSDHFRPRQVVVVSDACTDGTDEIVRSAIADFGVPLRLVSRPRRQGKAAAINRIIEELSDCSVIGLVSADVLPVGDCLEKLVLALEDEQVGVAGCRPLPEGPPDNLAAEVSRLLWALHHEIALFHPKSTEVTVFRNLGLRLDERSLTDEAEIEALLSRHGYRLIYLPEARVRVLSPLRVRDYLCQRTRVTRGHLELARRADYRVSTLSLTNRLEALRRLVRSQPVQLSILSVAALLESYIFVKALISQPFAGRADGVWTRIESSKRPLECVES